MTLPHELPWFPVIHTFPVKDELAIFALDKAEVIAIKALKEGVANEHQQQLALRAIVEKIARVHDMSFRPGGSDGERATAFAEGKRYVGAQIVRAINLPMTMSGDHAPSVLAARNSRKRPGQSEPESEPGAKRKPRPKPGTRDPGKETV